MQGLTKDQARPMIIDLPNLLHRDVLLTYSPKNAWVRPNQARSNWFKFSPKIVCLDGKNAQRKLVPADVIEIGEEQQENWIDQLEVSQGKIVVVKSDIDINVRL